MTAILPCVEPCVVYDPKDSRNAMYSVIDVGREDCLVISWAGRMCGPNEWLTVRPAFQEHWLMIPITSEQYTQLAMYVVAKPEAYAKWADHVERVIGTDHITHEHQD